MHISPELEKTIRYLEDEIKRHNDLYHNRDNPEISDSEYDALVRRYKSLLLDNPDYTPAYNPMEKVGSPSTSYLNKVIHLSKMMSLDNGFSDTDIRDFVVRIRRFLNLKESDPLIFNCEPKIDGLSCSLTYRDGVLVRAATRGDGSTGEDVTENVKYIPSIPKTIKDTNLPNMLEVRGEVYINKSDFDYLKSRGEIFANSRNAAAGSLRQKDASQTGNRYLNFIAHGSVINDNVHTYSYSELMEYIKSLGFDIAEPRLLTGGISSMLDYFNKINTDRNNIPFDIDGVVYKVDNLDYQNRLGITSKSPRWAIAHKFEAECATTSIENITTQVGRTGKLTPVASVSPVYICGVTITNVSLHNFDEVKRLNLNISDDVIVQRAGDVIPQIVRNISSKEGDDYFREPTNCPSCSSPIIKDDGCVDIRCSGGWECPDQKLARLSHFVSRDAINIVGIGESVLEELINKNWISEPADIFLLKTHRDEWIKMDGWGETSVSKILSEIEHKKKIDSSRVLFGLGIRHIGRVTANDLLKKYRNLDTITQLGITLDVIRTKYHHEVNFEELMIDCIDIPNIGISVAESLADFFSDDRNIKMYENLLNQISPSEYVDNVVSSEISGKTIAFTGKFESVSRDEAKAQAQRLGARVSGSISNNTDILVSGEGSGSKLKKALNLGIDVINESDWLKIVSSDNPISSI